MKISNLISFQLKKLYQFQSQEYLSGYDKGFLRNRIIEEYNLNEKRGFWSFFTSTSTYEGKTDNDKFLIRLTNKIISDKDPTYFFFMQVSGEIIQEENTTRIILNSELDERAIGMLISSSLIYTLIALFSIWLGVICFFGLYLIYRITKKSIKTDFTIFTKEFEEKIILHRI